MDHETVVCDMENGVWVARQAARPRARCWTWLSVLSFAMLVSATAVLALLYFQVIPTSKQGDLGHEKSEPEHYTNQLPQQLKLQAMESPKPAAHLIAEFSHGKVNWISNKGYAFMKNGMELKENKLVVPTAGLYFVYTQVVYSGKGCQAARPPIYLKHAVRKISEAYQKEMDLLSATKTACEAGSAHHWYQTIYLGGVFSLEEGDILSTHTDHHGHVDPKSAQNYFGVIAM